MVRAKPTLRRSSRRLLKTESVPESPPQPSVKKERAGRGKGRGKAEKKVAVKDDFQHPKGVAKTTPVKKERAGPRDKGKKVAPKLLAAYTDAVANIQGGVPAGEAQLVKVDSRFKSYFKKSSFPSGKREDREAFVSLVTTVLYQQLASNACRAMLRKFLQCFDLDYTGAEHVPDVFPTPAQVVKYGPERLQKNARTSGNKSRAIIDIARHFEDGDVSHDMLYDPNNTDREIAQTLLGMRGLGPWSVDMFLMFSLRRLNILPTADLGVRKGFQEWFKLKDLPSPDKMIELAQPWEPFRSLGTYAMWQVANEAKQKAKEAEKKKKKA